MVLTKALSGGGPGGGGPAFNYTTDQAQFAQGGWNPFTMHGAPGAHPGATREGQLASALRGTSGEFRNQNDRQLQTRLHGYLQGLTDAGMSNDQAQRYLYYELWNQRGHGLPPDKVSAAGGLSGPGSVFSGGQSNTVKAQTPGIVSQTEAATPIGQAASHFKDPSNLVRQAGEAYQTQIVAPALDQFNQTMGIASAYTDYLSRKGKKGAVNPLTANNTTAAKLGVPSGTQVSQDSLAQAAIQQFYDNTGIDRSAELQQGGYNVTSPKGSQLGQVSSAPIGNIWAGLKTGATGQSSFDTFLQNLGVGQAQTPRLNYGGTQEQNAAALQGLMQTAFGNIGKTPKQGGPSQASWNAAFQDIPNYVGGPPPGQQQVETLAALLSGARPQSSSQRSQDTLNSILSLLQQQNPPNPFGG